MKNTIFLLFIFISYSGFGQLTQTIRGIVRDKTTLLTLPGANVAVVDNGKPIGTITNENGAFELFDISIGRHDLVVSYIGYEPFAIRKLELNAGKEVVLDIELVEDLVAVEEIIVTAQKKGETWNKMAAISVRSFSVNETEKYAGSLGDPSRMAANFAGVITANDSRNDIIIRGNSPQGLLWKMEGMRIPNPNHFGALGSTGGPVSVLNNNVLANSDFFTGAFPAEYGNAMSGVFDLKMRNGNTKKHEYVGQIGFNGFEVGAEGPISKIPGASYLINYRYSVLAVMDLLGFDVANGAVPEYQDITMKLFLPTKKLGTFSLFAIGGDSNIEFSAGDEEGGSTYDNDNDLRTRNGSTLGIAGLTHRFFPDDKSNIYTTFSASYQGVATQIDSVFTNGREVRWFGENNGETRYSASTRYTRKYNAKNTLNLGATFESYEINYVDSVTGEVYDPKIPGYVKQLDTKESGLNLWQGFSEWQYRFNTNVTLYAGLHYQYFAFNSTASVDPRLSFSYKLSDHTKLSLAYGKHAQTQPFYSYFTETYVRETGEYLQTNNNLEMSKSHHFVGGFDRMVTPNVKLKLETYYQHLYNIPVEKESSYFSMLNAGSSFHQSRVDNLVNDGVGRNYGLEFTLERYLDDNYYFLVTTSIFDSKYKGSDNVWRNTEFNTNYVFNALGGYEFQINDNMSVDMNMKVIWSGGKRNIPIDLAQSRIDGEAVYNYDLAYEERENDYIRFDARISFVMNKGKTTQEWALDLTNLTNRDNVFSRYYNDETNNVDFVYQQAFFPMFLYRINF